MLTGRTVKSAAMKKLHGSTFPHNHDAPIADHPLSEEPTTSAPNHFDDEQREIWEFAIRNSPPNLIKRLDGGILEAYCIALCMHRRAVIELGKEELTVSKTNGIAQNPILGIINKQGELVRKHGQELGFSPISRPRILADNSKTPAISASMASQNHAKPKDAPKQSLESYLQNTPKIVNIR
jgi:P27 family predicted phage terminase small subunit